MSKLEVKNIYKIFGNSPKQMVHLLDKGLSKAEILKKYKHNVGVHNVSFSVGEGEIFVLMGLSGSGKSTMLRCINRLIEPTCGDILLDGIYITKANAHQLRAIRRRKIAMVFQHFALLPHRTILENVAFGLEIQKINMKERRGKALKMLDLVGLKGYHNARPGELSGGMQQRVGLARALATDADVLLMDEAFSALDPLIRTDMQDELLALQAEMRKTIVFITHDLDEALKLGSRIAIMRDGRIVQTGTHKEILENPIDDYVRKFTRDVNRVKIITADSIMCPPESIVLGKTTIKSAVKKITTLGLSAIFVTDRRNVLRGAVTADALDKLLSEGRSDLESIVDKDIPAVTPSDSIDGLIPSVLASDYPLAVVDEDNRLVGAILKSSVLAGIAGNGDIENAS